MQIFSPNFLFKCLFGLIHVVATAGTSISNEKSNINARFDEKCPTGTKFWVPIRYEFHCNNWQKNGNLIFYDELVKGCLKNNTTTHEKKTCDSFKEHHIAKNATEEKMNNIILCFNKIVEKCKKLGYLEKNEPTTTQPADINQIPSSAEKSSTLLSVAVTTTAQPVSNQIPSSASAEEAPSSNFLVVGITIAAIKLLSPFPGGR
jgi:hypothetical protein